MLDENHIIVLTFKNKKLILVFLVVLNYFNTYFYETKLYPDQK